VQEHNFVYLRITKLLNWMVLFLMFYKWF